MKLTQKIVFKRFLFSLVILLFIRIGTFLPVPDIHHREIAHYLQSHPTTKNFLSTFSASDLFVVGVFSLNIFPYVNATILVQLLTAISPKLAALQKDGDFAGRRAVNQLTRQITLGLAILQSSGISLYLKQILFNWNFALAINIVIWLTTGAMIVLWLSEMPVELREVEAGFRILVVTADAGRFDKRLDFVRLGRLNPRQQRAD